MNTLVIVLIAAVILFGAYVVYGRWLANKWGIDPKAETPAVKYNDGKDFVPTNGWTVFSHQFSSIAGAGPVTGAIQAAAFGWLPVLLWILIGGVFFGAVTDFGALYASVKNEGKSMGMIIEKYIGKFGRKIFLLFCWLFTLIVIAAFADMVAGTFNAYTVVDGQSQLSAAASTNGSAGMVSIMFMVFAVVFGLIQKKWNLSGWKEAVVGIVFIIASFVIGNYFPIELGKNAWSYITFVYIFFAAVLPMWLMKQPRDYMTTFMFIAMIVGAALGLVVAHPSMNLPVYTGFNNAKLGTMFPILFVTVACGAVSGFHSLVSSGTSSKTVANEKDMLKVGYGAMILESLLAVIALCVAGAAAANADTVTVKSGDTLSQIADENNTTVSSIQSLNSLQNIHLIFPGQKLVINANNGDAAVSTQQSAQTTQQSAQTTQQSAQTTQQASQQQTMQQASQQQKMQTTQQAVASSSEQAARDWIASRESGGSYTAQNGNYYGKYQLSSAYLGGDYSAENQERVANSYVLNRYGSWANAKSHWLQNGWY